MSFFKKIKKFALPAIGALLAGPIGPLAGLGLGAAGGAAIGSGISSYTTNHDPLSALLSAGGSYAGNAIGGNLLGGSLGTVADATGIGALPWSGASNAFGSNIGSLIGQSAASNIGATSIGSLVGSSLGSDLAGNAFASAPGAESPSMAAPAPFQAKREDELAAPASITGLGSLTSEQRATNLANQGVYGGGNGPDEARYFLNLENRKLVDDGGNVGDMSSLTPIEQSYLQRLGLGGQGNSRSLLEAISKWQPT